MKNITFTITMSNPRKIGGARQIDIELEESDTRRLATATWCADKGSKAMRSSIMNALEKMIFEGE